VHRAWPSVEGGDWRIDIAGYSVTWFLAEFIIAIRQAMCARRARPKAICRKLLVLVDGNLIGSRNLPSNVCDAQFNRSLCVKILACSLWSRSKMFSRSAKSKHPNRILKISYRRLR